MEKALAYFGGLLCIGGATAFLLGYSKPGSGVIGIGALLVLIGWFAFFGKNSRNGVPVDPRDVEKRKRR